MPAFMTFDGHSQSFVPEDPNHYVGAGYPTSTVIGSSSTSYDASSDPSMAYTGVPDMSQFQYQQQYPDAAAWEYDYSYDPNDPNSLGYDFYPTMDMSNMQASLPDDTQHGHGGHQDASEWYGYPAQGGSNQQQNWR